MSDTVEIDWRAAGIVRLIDGQYLELGEITATEHAAAIEIKELYQRCKAFAEHDTGPHKFSSIRQLNGLVERYYKRFYPESENRLTT